MGIQRLGQDLLIGLARREAGAIGDQPPVALGILIGPHQIGTWNGGISMGGGGAGRVCWPLNLGSLGPTAP
jgi:hypothetical protein